MAINVGDFGSATATGSGNAGAATVNNNDNVIAAFSLPLQPELRSYAYATKTRQQHFCEQHCIC